MKYFLDTEFVEDAKRHTIELISLALAAEDGRSYYAVSLDFKSDTATEWIKTNVLPKLPPRPKRHDARSSTDDLWKPRTAIAKDIVRFIGEDVPEFWGYFADYDWVVFCWLFGTMLELPRSFPRYCRDIKQLMDSLGVEDVPFKPKGQHSALADAEWNRRAYRWLVDGSSGG